METNRQAAKRAAVWAVGLGVAALVAWSAFDLWARRPPRGPAVHLAAPGMRVACAAAGHAARRKERR